MTVKNMLLSHIEKKEAEKEASKKIYIKIDDDDDANIEKRENYNIITINIPFKIEGNITYINKDAITEYKGAEVHKSIIYLANPKISFDDNSPELEEIKNEINNKDNIVILNWGYSLFRELINDDDIVAGKKVIIEYLGKYKKAVKKIPEISKVYNTSSKNKFFNIILIDEE